MKKYVYANGCQERVEEYAEGEERVYYRFCLEDITKKPKFTVYDLHTVEGIDEYCDGVSIKMEVQ